jgi:hypothetical protein
VAIPPPDLKSRRDVLFLLGGVAACACCQRSVAQGSVTIPIKLPDLVPSTPDASNGAFVPVLQFTPEQAQLKEAGAVGDILTAIPALGGLNAQIQSLAAERTRAGSALQQIMAERDRILDEFRHGSFCSRCNRSRSEIEAGGENFYVHLQRVNGQEIPATQDQINAKAQEYESRIKQAQAYMDSLDEQLKALRVRAADKVKEIESYLLIWNIACGARRNLIAVQADKVDSEATRDLNNASATLHKIRSQQQHLKEDLAEGSADAAKQLQALEGPENLWISFIERTQLEANQALAFRWAAMKQAGQDREHEYDRIAETFARIGIAVSYLPSRQITVSATNIGEYIPEARVFEGMALSVGPRSALASYSSGPVGGGIGAWGTATTEEVGAVIKIFDYSVSFGLSETRWSETGVKWSLSPSLAITKAVKSENAITIQLPELSN